MAKGNDYQVFGSTTVGHLERQLNIILRQIGQRFDKSEGLRGVTEWEGSVSNKITSVTDSTYTLKDDDYQLNIDTEVAVTVTLTNVEEKRTVIVKDSSGTAGTNNITVQTDSTALIDNSANAIMNANYISLTFNSDGTNWWIV